MVHDRLRSQQDKLSELQRIKPAEFASVAQAGLISDIKEHELKLEMKHKAVQPLQVKEMPAKINRFEKHETDIVSYQKKISELKNKEKDKRVQEEYEAFRRSINTTALPRALPQKNRATAEDKFYRRLLDQYEPISRERAKDMLDQIEVGMKNVNSKIDEKPFDQNFAEYCDSYKGFMNDLLRYHECRMQQGHALQEIHTMVDIVSQGRD